MSCCWMRLMVSLVERIDCTSSRVLYVVPVGNGMRYADVCTWIRH